MKNLYLLQEALDYIEANLCEPITSEEVAAHCYVSLSSLQKLFRYALRVGVKEYVIKRRLSRAATELLQSADTADTVLDIALRYQYNSAEHFTRSFKGLFGVTPSAFVKERRFSEFYPRMRIHYEEGVDVDMIRRQLYYDEAYEKLRSMRGSYAVCFDMRNLMKINAISREAGDAALREMVRRMDTAMGEECPEGVLLRIGGDEFVAMTGMTEETKAEVFAQKVLEQNGKTVLWNGQEIPVFIYAGIYQIPAGNNLRYAELFSEINRTIMEAKK